jgi:uncharacterized protein YgbK (DUF1537 family)
MPIVVLDDDPTGAQSVADVAILFGWDQADLAACADERAVHVLTNTRALSPAAAYETTAAAARAAVAALPGAPIVLRGDSTLRAHLAEEYTAVRDAMYGGAPVPLLVVPALPAAGRVTRGGVHHLVAGGVATPLHETEYARDPAFAYSDARLLAWAEERSGGLLPQADGREVPPDGVAAGLAALAGTAAVLVPDAETIEDLEAIAGGLRDAWARGIPVVVRSAPAFAAVLAGTLATGFVSPPPAGIGVLVVVGSYVPNSTRQLAALLARHPAAEIEVDVEMLARGEGVAELAAETLRRLAAHRLAVVATPRQRPPALESLEAGAAIAGHLADAMGRAAADAGVVVAKGGITSHVTAERGLHARTGRVVGPLVDGVSLWRLATPRGEVPYVVFPGNVGTEETLADVVDLLLGA